MAAPLYTTDLLRLAASLGDVERLTHPMAWAEKRSVTCGSRIVVDIDLDRDGRVARLGIDARACALGQASAALFAAHAIGRAPSELAEARRALTAWLAGEGDAPDWPGIAALAPALPVSARHPAIRLAFEAGAEAAEKAQTQALA